MSKDPGVSSSLIRVPSYEKLVTVKISVSVRSDAYQWGVFGIFQVKQA